MRYFIQYSCISHVGKCRANNQDNFACHGKYLKIENDTTSFPYFGEVSSQDSALFGVFDGIGGEDCGEVASYIAAKCAASRYIGKGVIEDLLTLCDDANEDICKYTQKNNLCSMGTTAAILVFCPHKIVLCNIGDSKIFRCTKGEITQISQDHVAAAAFGVKPALSQNLGIPPSELQIEPYISQGDYHNGDIYLICSDGLTDLVSTHEIFEILKNNQCSEASKLLLNLALDNGGTDNITLIVCNVAHKYNSILKKFIGFGE